jgi:hypothetical protein
MQSSTLLAASACALLFVAAACGSTASTAPQTSSPTDAGDTDSGGDNVVAADAGPDVDNGAPSTTYPAPHPAMPQLVNLARGSVLTTPKIYLVFFPGYPYKDQIVSFAQGLGATSYWGDATKEYGVGAIQYAGMIELSGPDANVGTSISDTDVEAFMNAKIASGLFGTPDANTIYSIFYPQTTTINLMGMGPLGSGASCSSFGGYHSDTPVQVNDAGPPQNYAFAVLPTCASFGGLTGIDGLSGATSHEWIEAATDPFPSTNMGQDSAYSSIDQDHLAWEVLGGGGEAGDLCVPEANAFFKPQGFDFTVQRAWSNVLAKGGHDPCAPNLPGTPYFQSAPVLDQAVSFTAAALGGTFHTKGVVIPVGSSKTIELDLFSDAATSGPWTVTATDALSVFLSAPPTMTFDFDRTTGVNGEKLHMTINMKSAQALAGGAHPFIINSKLGQTSHTWAGIAVEK